MPLTAGVLRGGRTRARVVKKSSRDPNVAAQRMLRDLPPGTRFHFDGSSKLGRVLGKGLQGGVIVEIKDPEIEDGEWIGTMYVWPV